MQMQISRVVVEVNYYAYWSGWIVAYGYVKCC